MRTKFIIAMTIAVVFAALPRDTFSQSDEPLHPAGYGAGVWVDGKYFGFVPGAKKDPRASAANRSSEGGRLPSATPSDRPSAVRQAVSREQSPFRVKPATLQNAVETESDPTQLGTEMIEGEAIETDVFEPEFMSPEVNPPYIYPPMIPLRVWGNAEYLLWWTKGMNTPALASTDPSSGVLPNGTVLFGNGGINNDMTSGGRIELGSWVSPTEPVGFEAAFTFVGNQDTRFVATQNDFPVLARPFFNFDPARNAQDARLIASPGVVQGTLSVDARTQFQSLEALTRRRVREYSTGWIDVVLGYRYAELGDQLRIDESTLSLAAPTTGTSFLLVDQFATNNTFHGGEVGFAAQRSVGYGWSWTSNAKMAFGSTRSRSVLTGSTTTTPPAPAAATQTDVGMFVQDTNSGLHDSHQFSTLGEFGVGLRQQWTPRCSTSFGYTFIYWGNVQRAGDQVDSGVNTTQIPPGVLNGPARPTFPASVSTFWAQAIRFGAELSF